MSFTGGINRVIKHLNEAERDDAFGEFMAYIKEYDCDTHLANIIDNNKKRAYSVPPEYIDDFFRRYEERKAAGNSLHFFEVEQSVSCLFLYYTVFTEASTYELPINDLTRKIGQSLITTLDYMGKPITMSFFKSDHMYPQVKNRNNFRNKYTHSFEIRIFLKMNDMCKHYLCDKFDKILGKNNNKTHSVKVGLITKPFLYGSSKLGETPVTHLKTKNYTYIIEDDNTTSSNMNEVACNSAHDFSINHDHPHMEKPHATLTTHVLDEIEKLKKNSLEHELIKVNDIIKTQYFPKEHEALYIRKLLSELDIKKNGIRLLSGREIKFIIRSVKLASELYKPLAKEWLIRNNAYNKTTFRKFWREKPEGTTFSIGVIHHYLRKQNPKMAKKLNSESVLVQCIKLLMENGGTLNDGKRADLAYALWGHMYSAGDVKVSKTRTERVLCRLNLGNIEEKFKHTRKLYKWEINCSEVHIRLAIEKELEQLIKEARETLKVFSRRDVDKKKDWDKFFTKVCGTINSLGMRGKISSAFEMFKDRIYKEEFLDDMDQDHELIGCLNGVISLKGDKPTLINGLHPYKVSKTCNAEYYPYDPEDPYIKELEKIFKDIIPEECAREEILMICGSTICPHTPMMFLLQLYGGGANGKSTIVELVSEVLDEYSQKGETSVFTNKRYDASGPDSQTCSYENKRLVSFSESNAWDEIADGLLKKLRNNEKVAPRNLFKDDHKKFLIIARMISTSNYLFIVNSMDDGTWRRIRVYNCKTKFCDNPNPNNKYEKMANSKIENYKNDPKYRNAMLSILVKYALKFKNEYNSDFSKIKSPVMNSHTMKYRSDQDKVMKFLKQNVLEMDLTMGSYDDFDDIHDGPYSINDIVNIFTEWYKKIYGSYSKNMVPSIIKATLENSALGKYLDKDPITGEFILNEQKYRILEPGKSSKLEVGERYLFLEHDKKSKSASRRSSKANSVASGRSSRSKSQLIRQNSVEKELELLASLEKSQPIILEENIPKPRTRQEKQIDTLDVLLRLCDALEK